MTRFLTLALIILSAESAAAQPKDSQPKAAPVTFEGEAKAVLRKQCGSCHNTQRPRGDLDLTTFSGVKAGGVSGKSVISGKPDQSLLYTLSAHTEDPKMPPNSPKIPQKDLEILRNWIAGGLIEKPDDATTAAIVPKTSLGGLGTPNILPRSTPITALAASPTTPLVAVSGVKQVLVFELTGPKLLGGLPFPEGEVHTLRFSKDGTVLLAGGGVGGQSGVVVGFEVGTWKRLFTIGDEPDAVLAADLSPDKSRVALGGSGRVVKVLSVADGKTIHTFQKPTDWVLSVAFSPEGLLVAAGDRFGGVFVWETGTGKEFYTLKGHTKGITGLAWSADSESLATASEDGTVRVWSMHTGETATKWMAHEPGVAAVAWHPSGKLATVGRDRNVQLWNPQGKALANLGETTDTALGVAFTSDAKAVVTGDWAGEASVFPIAMGESTRLSMPVSPNPPAVAIVPVPNPTFTTAAPVKPEVLRTAVTSATDLLRKRAALKVAEEAVEKFKEEAARAPDNKVLADAYLKLCEAALAMKAEIIKAEATALQEKN